MIFVDTSFWVAALNRRDERYAPALRLMETYGSQPLVTTNHVRGETWTVLRRRSGHRAAVEFLELTLRSPRLRVFRVTDEQEEQALLWLRHRSEREYSFVDATSFAVMSALRLTEALAFDDDFSAAGFLQLRL